MIDPHTNRANHIPTLDRLIAVLGLIVVFLSSAAFAVTTTDVYVGKVVTIDVGTVERVAVGNEGIVEASVLGNGKVVLLGKAPGLSDIYIWTTGERVRNLTVRVYPEPKEDQLSKIRSVINAFPDVQVKQHLGLVILDGTVDAGKFEAFQAILGAFSNVVSLVEPQLNISIQDSIVLDVKILEIDRNAQRQLGVRWADTTAGPVFGAVGILKPNSNFGVVSDSDNVGDLQDILSAVGTGSTRLSTFFGITSIFGSQIDLLQDSGAARTLAAPSLSTVSGEPAEFLAGGEIPVAVLNQFGQPIVEFHEFGIALNIEPVMDRNQNIRARIATSVSTVDFSTLVNGVPGFLERNAASTITARPGDTIVISGLVNLEDSRNVDKVPGLGDIPILGALFRSKGFRQRRTELIITVTPRIRPANTGISADFIEAEKGLRDVLSDSDKLDDALLW